MPKFYRWVELEWMGEGSGQCPWCDDSHIFKAEVVRWWPGKCWQPLRNVWQPSQPTVICDGTFLTQDEGLEVSSCT